MKTEINDILRATAVDLIKDNETLSNKTYSSAQIEGRLTTEIGRFEAIVNSLKAAVDGLKGATVYRGIMDTDTVENLNEQLSSYIYDKYERGPQVGDQVKIYQNGSFYQTWKYGDAWELDSTTESISQATTENSGIITIATNEQTKEGTSADIVVTPQGVKEYIDNITEYADESFD